MRVTGVNHITLRVSSLKKSLPFYCDILGMKLIHQGKKDVYLEWGHVWICLLEKEKSISFPPESCGIDHVAFSILEPDFMKAVKTLQQHQISLVREPVLRGGGWSVQFKDPDEIMLELFTGSLAERMKDWK
ncbi:VOC family protein [Hazenella coriacea]|uniref:Metallothiol transferase n=1 Tax=Hazenella coriacea TaxID=1179467 RepID=A0A4V2UVS9_9BACL|nr:VOC family protein [Hazenella coriacea]TCS96967.1 metallothiol transferase [Hazenella coriacea]